MIGNSSRAKRSIVAGIALTALTAMSIQSNAQLALTGAGIARGFTLSTFATGFANGGPFGVGPLGMGFNGDGSVLVADYYGAIHRFATDTDGQVATAGNTVSTSGVGVPVGIASSGGNLYMTDQANGVLRSLSAGGAVGAALITGMPAATGITTNPTNGHLFVSTLGNNVIWDIDPVAVTKTNFLNQSADGLSTDGTTLYMESNAHILGYRISDKALVFDSGAMGCGPDGTELGSGSLLGYIYVNCNNGQFFEINLGSNSQVAIADTGSRGDFVQTDTHNGTLMITQTDRVIRMTAPKGGGFGGTPEPGVTASLAGMGMFAAGMVWRKYRKN